MPIKYTTTRRQFVKTTAGALAATTLAPMGCAAASKSAGQAEKKLDILFLGGTGMVGPFCVDYALERGHKVTLFNRGRRPNPNPAVTVIEGNRIVDEGPGLDPLKELVDQGKRWDAVIDTASVHTWTENSARLLRNSADQYLYISSLSAYGERGGDGGELTEDQPVATMPDDIADSIDRLPYDMQYYGAVKARSEAAAERYFPGRATIIRPGLIGGPRDSTMRFNYWPVRVRKGGEVLAPGEAWHPVMFIDSKDLGKFWVTVLERKAFGIYNAQGANTRGMTMGKLLETCKKVTRSDAEFVWAEADFLAQRGINAWQQMPLWIPPVGEYQGFHKVNIDRAIAAGLTARPLTTMLKDTLEWFDNWIPRVKEQNPEFDYSPGGRWPGVTPEQEAQTIAEWREHLATTEAG